MAEEDDSGEDTPVADGVDGAHSEGNGEGEGDDEVSERTEIECSLGALSVAVRTPHDDAEQLFERVWERRLAESEEISEALNQRMRGHQ